MTVKSFDDLSNQELYDIMVLRQTVFVVEQDCPYLDADGSDRRALHLMHYTDAGLAAYARVLPRGVSYPDYASVGRIVVAKSFRGKGLGSRITLTAIDVCKENFGESPIKISAQCYILEMYSALGFEAVGETYLEDGIPHQAMIWKGGSADQ